MRKRMSEREEVLRCYAKWLESFIGTICRYYVSEGKTDVIKSIIKGRCHGVVAEAMERKEGEINV